MNCNAEQQLVSTARSNSAHLAAFAIPVIHKPMEQQQLLIWLAVTIAASTAHMKHTYQHTSHITTSQDMMT
jgi:hypothetical protein